MEPNSYLERIRNALPDRLTTSLGRMGRFERRAGVLSALLMLTLLAQPVAAQNEHCSSALTAMFNIGLGMLFGYSRELIILVLFVSVLMMLANPAFDSQRVVGLGIFSLTIVALMMYMGVIEFVNLSFEQINAPSSCTGYFGGGEGGDGGDGAENALVLLTR